MLKLSRLTKSFDPTLLFRDLSLELVPGEYVAVMGDSGSGKSTFLNIVAGLDSADAGEVSLDGESINAADDDTATLWRRRALGFVFQSFHVLPHLTIAQNVALPLKLNGCDATNIRSRVSEMLEAVELADRHSSYPRELSGGETQRVAIARALVHGPRLILADEPTGNLDPATAETILSLLASEIRRNNAMGILVTHSDTAAASADRVLRLTRAGLQPHAI
ncbi:MAG: ABC transporter ATP-binding protein [Burkholderiales bacterium]|nr:ABC transporter ATP-binding protein [Burkholderiales bacterium]